MSSLKYNFDSSGEKFFKNERLCSRNIIKTIFSTKEKKTLLYPFVVRWIELPLANSSPVQIMITAPKSKLPKAHHRNKLKRLVREAYRRNKSPLYSKLICNEKQIALSIVYIESSVLPYSVIEKKIAIILRNIFNHYN